MEMAIYSIDKLMSETRRIAAEYRRATGKTLPVSAEIALHDGIRLLNLEPNETSETGYDAIRRCQDGRVQRIQIKGRVVFDEQKVAHRIGQLRMEQNWDSVVLVLMDEDYDPIEVYETVREDIMEAIGETEGSKRSKRGAMSVARFKIIGRLVWTRENGLEDDEYQTYTA